MWNFFGKNPCGERGQNLFTFKNQMSIIQFKLHNLCMVYFFQRRRAAAGLGQIVPPGAAGQGQPGEGQPEAGQPGAAQPGAGQQESDDSF